eukprot:9370894-Alexandrium_andersonii.AAC.1
MPCNATAPRQAAGSQRAPGAAGCDRAATRSRQPREPHASGARRRNANGGQAAGAASQNGASPSCRRDT